MMRFTFEHPKQFTRITNRLQGAFQNPGFWFPCDSEKGAIKSVNPQEYETVVSMVKDILIGNKIVEPKSGSVYCRVALFKENICYQDAFFVFEEDLMELLKYFGVK